jgi:hypothetical protein
MREMSGKIRYLLLFGLIAYSVSLMVTEVMTSQDYVRLFFTDIKGDIPLYAVNTTVSYSLLWATALLFAVCLASLKGEAGKSREFKFYLSQLIIFGYLGFDDRFMVHERVGGETSLLFIGMAEAYCLWKYGRVLEQRWQVKRFLILGVLFFGMMMAMDLFGPEYMLLRLSLEDLSKTWANVFFFSFAWTICLDRIHFIKSNSSPGESISYKEFKVH